MKEKKIIIEKDTLTFCYSLKKTRVIKYHDIHCLLFVPLGNKTSMVLIDDNYNRLNELDSTLDNLDVLFEMLAEKGVSIIDFEELVEQNKNVSKIYFCFELDKKKIIINLYLMKRIRLRNCKEQ